MQEIINSYLEYLEKYLKKSNNSVLSYKYDLKKYKVWLNINDLKSLNVTKKDANEYVKYLSKELNLSSSSINRVISTQRSFYDFLVDNDYCSDNVFKKVDNLKMERKLPEFITIDEVKFIIDNCDSKRFKQRDQLVIGLMFYGGMRISEVVELKYDNIFLEDDYMIINGKGNKQRHIFLIPELKELLLNYMECSYESKCNNIIINRFGNKMSRQSLWTIVQTHTKLINKKITPHTFRHSFATYLLENGLNQYEIKELLGHVSITTTEVYTHITNKFMKDKYLEKIDLINEDINEK